MVELLDGSGSQADQVEPKKLYKAPKLVDLAALESTAVSSGTAAVPDAPYPGGDS